MDTNICEQGIASPTCHFLYLYARSAHMNTLHHHPSPPTPTRICDSIKTKELRYMMKQSKLWVLSPAAHPIIFCTRLVAAALCAWRQPRFPVSRREASGCVGQTLQTYLSRLPAQGAPTCRTGCWQRPCPPSRTWHRVYTVAGLPCQIEGLVNCVPSTVLVRPLVTREFSVN